MPIHVTCSCGQRVAVPDDHAGNSVPCPGCGRQLSIPTPAAPPIDPVPDPVEPPPSFAIQPRTVDQYAERLAATRRIHAVYWLAVALVAIALISVVPVLLLAWEQKQQLAQIRLEPWAYGVTFLAMLQLAYVIYLVQLPDWSTVRVVSILTLLHATAYAGLMGIRLLAGPGNPIMQQLGLESSRFTSDQQAGWCLVLVLLYGSLSHLAGRQAGRWHG